MKIVAKYTLVLAAALTVALTLLAFLRVELDREHYRRDMVFDHRVVGGVLQAGVVDVWIDAASPERATMQTLALIQRANETGGVIRFEWIAGARAGGASQRVEGHDFVSRFPIRSGGVIVGAVVGREPLDEIERLVRADVILTAVEIGLVVIIGWVLSMVLGRWLVGRPVSHLVAQARRIGRRDFSGELTMRRADEIGELAAEMAAMRQGLVQARWRRSPSRPRRASRPWSSCATPIDCRPSASSPPGSPTSSGRRSASSAATPR